MAGGSFAWDPQVAAGPYLMIVVSRKDSALAQPAPATAPKYLNILAASTRLSFAEGRVTLQAYLVLGRDDVRIRAHQHCKKK